MLQFRFKNKNNDYNDGGRVFSEKLKCSNVLRRIGINIEIFNSN